MPTKHGGDGDDIFESDPFFSPEAPRQEPEPTRDSSFEADEIPEEDVPSITLPSPDPGPASIPETIPQHTAEERLLDSIVGSTPESRPDDEALAKLTAELNSVRSEFDIVVKTRQDALSSRDRARQDLQVLKTRFAALETDLATARAEATKANHLKVQAETRYADAEKQWSDKLAQLRRMLDDVEVMRDELNSKRVPKILFTGTLAAGVLCTAMALFIGYTLGRPDAQTMKETAAVPVPSSPDARSQSSVPAAPGLPRLPSSSSLPLTPLAPSHEHLPVPLTPPNSANKGIAARMETTAITLPQPPGARWTSTTLGNETTVVFQYGLFAEGPELTVTAKQDLEAIASFLKATRFQLEVEGHTDSTAASKSKSNATGNKALGLARARKVSAYLVQQCGLAPERVTVSSAGEFRPPFPNTTAESRKMNRTVILKVRAK